MPKIALLDDWSNVARDMADWASLGPEFETVAFPDNLVDPDALAARLADFEIVCAMRERTPFPKAVFDKLPNLKLFMTSGMRNASVDFDAARANGVVCCGTQSTPRPTVELTWALIFGLARQIPRDDRVMKAGGWQSGIGIELAGRTLGVLGLGRLGAQVAEIGKVMRMNVIAWSANLTEERCREVGVELVGKEELFSRSDILTIHLVLSDRSRGLVGADDLARMKSTALLINTSRGPIVDEAALLDTLSAKRIGGAAIDVYGTEPLPADAPIRGLDNVVLSPHMGYVTEETFRVFYGQMVENIAAWSKGAPIREID